MGVTTKYVRFSLYQHSSAALKPPKSVIAIATVDPYLVCLQGDGQTEEAEEGSVRAVVMTLTSPEMERPPKVFFSLSFPSLLPEEAVRTRTDCGVTKEESRAGK